MKVAIYCRQSVDKKESLSIESQINMCKKECDKDDSLKIYKDKGFSGKNTKRPQFQQMMVDVRLGKIDRIIVYRLDRLSRSIVDFANMWDVLNKFGVSFTSVSEKFDTSTPMGRTMIYIIMIFAQLERETISERVKDNYYERTKYGSWLGGPAPFGFDNGKIVTEDGRSVPTLVMNENIEIVKKVFSLYVQEGETLSGIAKWLTESGVCSEKNKTWDNVSVSRMLHSPLYVCADVDVYNYYKAKGVTKFSNEIDAFQGITSAMLVGKRDASTRKYSVYKDQTLALTNFIGVIESDLWLACQYKLERNRQMKNSGSGTYTWLTGLVKCKKCGYAIVVKKGKRKAGDYIYFSCSGRTNKHVCDVSRFETSIEEIEEIVQERIEKIISQFKDDKTEFFDIEENEIKCEIAKIDAKIEHILELVVESNEVTVSYLNKKIEELDQKKRQLYELACKSKAEDHNIMENIVFDQLNMQQKHFVAEQYIDKILVDDEEINIVWKC